MERINDPRLTGEINRYRGRRETKEILDKMLKDTTERQGKLLRELIVVEHDLEQVMRRLERADAYRELESQFRLTFPLPTQPRHYQSPLTEPPVASPMPPCPRGPVEMPILAGEEPKGRRRSRCYRCKSREHKVSQCPARRRNEKCVNCGDTKHRKSKCPFRPLRQSPGPQVISPFAEARTATRNDADGAYCHDGQGRVDPTGMWHLWKARPSAYGARVFYVRTLH